MKKNKSIAVRKVDRIIEAFNKKGEPSHKMTFMTVGDFRKIIREEIERLLSVKK